MSNQTELQILPFFYTQLLSFSKHQNKAVMHWDSISLNPAQKVLLMGAVCVLCGFVWSLLNMYSLSAFQDKADIDEVSAAPLTDPQVNPVSM